ncbi:family 16 glycosyl hydrolase [Coprinopsis sp. MPI-PUGE-AT-0042]|nr:family 16 glycosyl hydrolase [Coprinopsis sp. MPI-PUGE-AT-0042]
MVSLWGRLTSAALVLYASLVLYATIVAAKAYGPEPLEARDDNYDRNRDGSPFLWLLEDDYKAPDFFDHMLFYTDTDPTHGLVTYVSKEEAFARNLAFISDDGKVVMKADTETTLERGQPRASVRIETIKHYTTGLFILDLDTAPWGCGIWPAWWTTTAPWPDNGEIDIIEGVHDNEHNQVAWHTSPGCLLDSKESFSGNISIKSGGPATDCDAAKNDNAGCSVTEWSRASYGPYFDEQGGGVFAMKWDENGISVCESFHSFDYPVVSMLTACVTGSFYRAAVPADIPAGAPNPKKWGRPSALLGPEGCEIEKFFKDHTIVINITFCGDWAGNSYAATKCPGTCDERIMDPKNFVNASWNINSMKVYRKQTISAVLIDPSSSATSLTDAFTLKDWYSIAGAVGFAGIPLAAGYALVN